MNPLDPAIARQFGWGDTLDIAAVVGDPALSARLLASYQDDPAYSPPQIPWSEVLVDGPLGSGTLPLRVYTPASPATQRPCLVWAHGGGFSGGDLTQQEADGVAREVAARADAVVLSVGYHLADGTVVYPVLHEEVATAVTWATDNAEQLGIDPGRLAVGGASAGASLAVAATLALRDSGARLPSRLVLAYPALHDTQPPARHGVDPASIPRLLRIPPELTAYMWQNYVGRAQDAQYATVDGVDLGVLPEVLVIPAEYDDLRSSAESFVDQATSDGVRVEVRLAAGAAHGFLNMTPSIAATDEALTDIAQFVAGRPAADAHL